MSYSKVVSHLSITLLKTFEQFGSSDMTRQETALAVSKVFD